MREDSVPQSTLESNMRPSANDQDRLCGSHMALCGLNHWSSTPFGAESYELSEGVLLCEALGNLETAALRRSCVPEARINLTRVTMVLLAAPLPAHPLSMFRSWDQLPKLNNVFTFPWCTKNCERPPCRGNRSPVNLLLMSRPTPGLVGEAGPDSVEQKLGFNLLWKEAALVTDELELGTTGLLMVPLLKDKLVPTARLLRTGLRPELRRMWESAAEIMLLLLTAAGGDWLPPPGPMVGLLWFRMKWEEEGEREAETEEAEVTDVMSSMFSSSNDLFSAADGDKEYSGHYKGSLRMCMCGLGLVHRGCRHRHALPAVDKTSWYQELSGGVTGQSCSVRWKFGICSSEEELCLKGGASSDAHMPIVGAFCGGQGSAILIGLQICVSNYEKIPFTPRQHWREIICSSWNNRLHINTPGTVCQGLCPRQIAIPLQGNVDTTLQHTHPDLLPVSSWMVRLHEFLHLMVLDFGTSEQTSLAADEHLSLLRKCMLLFLSRVLGLDPAIPKSTLRSCIHRVDTIELYLLCLVIFLHYFNEPFGSHCSIGLLDLRSPCVAVGPSPCSMHRERMGGKGKGGYWADRGSDKYGTQTARLMTWEKKLTNPAQRGVTSALPAWNGRRLAGPGSKLSGSASDFCRGSLALPSSEFSASLFTERRCQAVSCGLLKLSSQTGSSTFAVDCCSFLKVSLLLLKSTLSSGLLPLQGTAPFGPALLYSGPGCVCIEQSCFRRSEASSLIMVDAALAQVGKNLSEAMRILGDGQM
ncbi:hypothetical protein CCH79_00015716 [Gambusia affinis]|uniref:Uncharacterized protein n=1 Tax=Gambusia affinis TaxID=33528 RepID=A0A315W3M7_GAMAF|nr:hypothetical protein CCH79_00015716 [Gambusia affinis]